MMNYNNIIKVAATLSLATLFSCAEMEDPQSGAVGYLAAPAFEVDVTVQDMAQTKASKPAVESPATSDIHFVVKDKDGNVKYDANGLWTEALVLPVGAYTVDAVYGSNGFGAPYFTGTASGNIDPLDSEVPALTMSLANSLVCVELDSEFAQHFDVGSTKVVLKSGSASAEVGYGQWIYVSSGADLEVTMAGVTAGESVTLTHKLSSPSPKVAYNLVCKKSSTSWPSIAWQSTTLSDGAFEGGLYFLPASATNMSAENAASMVYQVKGGSYSEWTEVSASDVNGYKYISGLSNGVTYSLRASVGNIVSEEQSFTPVTFQNCFSMGSVTAAHNNNGNADVELSSTTMTAGSMEVNLPATIAKMATVKAAGSFSSSNNAATGSFSDVALSTTSQNASFTNATDWPYLPQGTYSAIVTATCTLNGATFTATATKTATVPAPVFKVTASAYTSYDKYLEYKSTGSTEALNAANKSGYAEYIYQISATVGISEALLTNSNYGTTKVYYTCGPYTDYEQTFVNPTGDQNSSVKVNNIGDVSGFSWGDNKLTARVVFAGSAVTSDPHSCHITGLPYSYNFVGGSLSGYSSDGWTCNGNLEVSNKTLAGRATTLVLDSNGSWSNQHGYVVSPRFHIPDIITVQPSILRSVYRSSGNNTRTGYVGPVSNTSTSTTSISYTVSGGNNTGGSIAGSGEWLQTGFTMTTSTPYVAVDSDKRSEAGWSYYFLHEVGLRYM